MNAGDAVRVLIVEDEWLIAETLANHLIAQGYSVVGIAPDVATALDLVAIQTPDCAVLDVTLRDEKSFPVADQLQRQDIPFVFVSGYMSCDLLLRFKGRPLLVKPVDPEALRTVVAELTTRRVLSLERTTLRHKTDLETASTEAPSQDYDAVLRPTD
jgi:two-component system, response regulator PdtaR